jgi:hypothetical protein
MGRDFEETLSFDMLAWGFLSPSLTWPDAHELLIHSNGNQMYFIFITNQSKIASKTLQQLTTLSLHRALASAE